MTRTTSMRLSDIDMEALTLLLMDLGIEVDLDLKVMVGVEHIRFWISLPRDEYVGMYETLEVLTDRAASLMQREVEFRLKTAIMDGSLQGGKDE